MSVYGRKLVFCGDARNNVGNSLMVASAKLGVNFTCCAPKDLWPDEELTKKCEEIARENGSTIQRTEDIMEGTKDADAIYTDVWVSMGEPMEKWAERINYLRKYQVNQSIIDNAKDDCIFLHCLPRYILFLRIHHNKQLCHDHLYKRANQIHFLLNLLVVFVLSFFLVP